MKFKPTSRPGGMVVEMASNETQLPSAQRDFTGGALPVFQLKNILVPTDFSDGSSKALHYAISFAKQFGAALTLLHVIEPYVPVGEMAPLTDGDSVEHAEKQLQAMQQMVVPEITSKVLVRLGRPHLEIIEAARQLGSDLIIISTHGRTGLEHVLLGSTAEKVVRYAVCPVLVIRQHEHDFIPGDEADWTEGAAQK